MAQKIEKNRMIHFDLLRIIAAFSVVMLHSSAQFWYDLDIHSVDWVIANSYNALFRFGVPIFVMISGALFLAPGYPLDTKRLYKHNILRLCVMYVVWSCLYGLLDYLRFYRQTASGIKVLLREMIYGRYHLWFLPMIVGIYVLLPILKSWIEHAEQKVVRYFLGLFIVLQICSETLRALTVTDELHVILDVLKVEMACSYLGYFVLGYYLVHVGISQKLRKMIYICVVPSLLFNVFLGNALAWKVGYPVGMIYDSFGLFTFVIVLALFLVITDKGAGWNMGRGWQTVIREISADTLGIYVLHVGLMELTEKTGFQSMMFPNILGIPVYAIGCFIICMMVAALVRRIPFVGKYIC